MTIKKASTWVMVFVMVALVSCEKEAKIEPDKIQPRVTRGKAEILSNEQILKIKKGVETAINNPVKTDEKSTIPPIIIWAPVGCNFPSPLGRSFAIKKFGPLLSPPYPQLANPDNDRILVFYLSTGGPLSPPFWVLLSPELNPFENTWEVGASTVGWPVGDYIMLYTKDYFATSVVWEPFNTANTFGLTNPATSPFAAFCW